MQKPNNNLRENTVKVLKEKEIKSEIARVKKLYKKLPKEKTKVLEGLINEAAFMKITLQELRENILEKGTTELFEQGEQKFIRKNPMVEIYTTMISRYSNVMKQLIDLFPEEEKKPEVDALMDFVKKGINK
ncbi:hypothetical protein [Marinisporobacter balticus]|uniref:Phage terminase small subunit n=1 Tax=Marinisporobacter balticus TaxID=2018667 RepID=A0A4R2K806_9FIRM|nr:hypothetical protein [Marinisporobacter balticus]TCO69511.1 hypothetical protein EV214_13135 [Marinisporobacter balticus]